MCRFRTIVVRSRAVLDAIFTVLNFQGRQTRRLPRVSRRVGHESDHPGHLPEFPLKVSASRRGRLRPGSIASVIAVAFSTAVLTIGASPEKAVAASSSFVPIWATMAPEPGGCSEPLASGYVLSGPIDQSTIGCGWNSAGAVDINGAEEPKQTVDFVWFHSATSVSYSFTVPAGTTEQVSYGIPTGGFLNNAPATISGVGPSTTVCDGGTSPSDCSHLPGFDSTTSADDVLWTTPPSLPVRTSSRSPPMATLSMSMACG